MDMERDRQIILQALVEGQYFQLISASTTSDTPCIMQQILATMYVMICVMECLSKKEVVDAPLK